jgi:hypothetical protein
LSFSVGVTISYFVVPGLSLGVTFGDQLDTTTDGDWESTSNVFILGLAPGYTFRFGESPFFLFVDLVLGYGSGASETTSASAHRASMDMGGLAVGGGAGIGVALGERTGAAVSVGFSTLYLSMSADVERDGAALASGSGATALQTGLTTQLAVFF